MTATTTQPIDAATVCQRRPWTPQQLRDALGSLHYFATRCQNPECLSSTVPCTGGPDRSTFPNWPRMDTARCRVCGNGFAKHFELVGSAAAEAFLEETKRNALEQEAARKRREAEVARKGRASEPAAARPAKRGAAK